MKYRMKQIYRNFSKILKSLFCKHPHTTSIPIQHDELRVIYLSFCHECDSVLQVKEYKTKN